MKNLNNYVWQHRIKLIAGFSQFTKVLADFLSVIYLLTLVLKHATKSYTNTLRAIVIYLLKFKESKCLSTLTLRSFCLL